MTPPRVHRILLIFPIGLFILSLILVSAWGPYYVGGRVDPEYFELTNAVSALTFHVPPNTDHPGTTVQVLAGLVILLKWLVGGMAGNWLPVDSAVFLNPEGFLHTINLVINILIAVSIYYAARSLYIASGSLPAAIVLQLSVLLFPQTLTALCRVSPEPLLIAIGFALMIPLIRLVYADDGTPYSTDPLARRAGIFFGLGVITKASMFPLASVLLLMKGRRQKLWFSLSCVAVAMLFLLPSAPKFSDKVNWFVSLGTHSGFYGTGPSSLPESGVMKLNSLELYQYDPSLFFLFAIYCAGLILAYLAVRSAPSYADSRILMVLLSGCIAILLGTILILMHFRAHYMVPFLVWVSFLNGMIVAHYPSRDHRTAGWCLLLGIAVAGVFGLWHTAKSLSQWADSMREERAEASVLTNELKSMSHCIQVGFYLSSLPSYALHFGNEMALTQHGKTLEELYPESLAYAYTEGRFYSFTRQDKTDQIVNLVKKGTCVVAQGSIRPNNEMVLPKALRWDLVIAKRNQAIYALSDNSTESKFPAMAEFLHGDTQHQGSWKGTYGRTAVAIAGEAANWPSSATA